MRLQRNISEDFSGVLKIYLDTNLVQFRVLKSYHWFLMSNVDVYSYVFQKKPSWHTGLDKGYFNNNLY